MTLDIATVSTPIGPITLIARDGKLVGLEFSARKDRVRWLRKRLTDHLGEFDTREHKDPAGAATRLRRYFAGDSNALDDQPVELHGTEFERSVWKQLKRIPTGRTISYRTLAERVGQPSAARAVGGANGRNPIALFVPCHRVIAADGTLGGYGGGLDRKRQLLKLEGALEPTLL
ncbi:MAG: methylated-DNA--[protein]-cysteine S-methyltransferase [Candidatus Eisenbacteria bacterium]|uniref:Methylated-DNA--protein-cysteine methyltransferase n=1 Tax=Eiseniibacteriota bacterium TaxID=2212470 RepID=A0A849SKU6_UNCEI|nr:methylated-DNA--[protein]-cysteine S-methyltransferase [Candidatus Eisenbacteria bacterium]